MSARMWRSVVTFQSRKNPAKKAVLELVSWTFTFRDKRRSRYHAIWDSAASNVTTMAKRGVMYAQGLLCKVRLRCDQIIMEYTYKEYINVLLHLPPPPPPLYVIPVMLQIYGNKREERVPTRCNNIDDLLSIPDVYYWLQSRHVSGIFMPISRRKDHVLLHMGFSW